MAAVPAQLPDEFGPGPMDDSVLRFIKTHRACAVWEGKVTIRFGFFFFFLFGVDILRSLHNCFIFVFWDQ